MLGVRGSRPSRDKDFSVSSSNQAPVFTQDMSSRVLSGYSGFLPPFKIIMDAANKIFKNKILISNSVSWYECNWLKEGLKDE